MKKLLFALLLFLSLSFASWQTVTGLAMITSLAILLVIFMLGFGFNINEFTLMAKEEFYQLLVLGIMIAVLIGADGGINYASQWLELTGDHDNIQAAALASIETTQSSLRDYFNGLVAADNKMEAESGKSTYCSILGAGYSVSGCGGFGMLSPMFSMAASMVGFAIGELAAMEKLIEISTTYALSLLLPFGILLRTLKLTRGAGGLLIGLAVSMHIMLPLGILLVDMMGENFISYGEVDSDGDGVFDGEIHGLSADIDEPYHPESTMDIGVLDTGFDFDGEEYYVCDAANVFFGENEERAVGAYHVMRENTRMYMYVVLIKATLGPITALLMLITSLRFLTGLAGAEVDISALAKVV